MGSWRIFGWIGSNMTSGNELSDICSLLNLVCNAALRGQAKKFVEQVPLYVTESPSESLG